MKSSIKLGFYLGENLIHTNEYDNNVNGINCIQTDSDIWVDRVSDLDDIFSKLPRTVKILTD
jgi:hypothetical protein